MKQTEQNLTDGSTKKQIHFTTLQRHENRDAQILLGLESSKWRGEEEETKEAEAEENVMRGRGGEKVDWTNPIAVRCCIVVQTKQCKITQ